MNMVYSELPPHPALARYVRCIWVFETSGERFDKHWIAKQSIHNYNPIGFQGFAMNMRREPYNDKRVRKALAHLLDRKRMNQTIMFDQYTMTSSYWPDLWDEKNPNPNVETVFDVEKARALLKEAGWAVNPATGKLEKGGKAFAFALNDLYLQAEPSAPVAGDTVVADLRGGTPGTLGLIVLIDVSGTPVFEPLLLAAFDTNGELQLCADVDSSVSGLDFTIMGYAQARTGRGPLLDALPFLVTIQ